MDCRNCHQPIVTNADFCHECGAKIVREPLIFRQLFTDFWYAVTNLDNGLWPTIRDMSRRPAKVILGYIDGLRKRYTAPAAYAIIIGAVYGLVVIIYPDAYLHEEFLEGLTSGGGGESETLAKMRSIMTPLRLPLMYFPVFPIILLNWLFYKKQQNRVGHAVIGLYYFAHLTLIYLAITLIFAGAEHLIDNKTFTNPLGALTFLASTVFYKLRVYREVYHHQKRWHSIAKPLLLLLFGFLLNLLPYLFILMLTVG